MVKRALQIPHIDTHKGYNETEPLFILDFIERHDFFHRLLPILEPVPYRVLVSNLWQALGDDAHDFSVKQNLVLKFDGDYLAFDEVWNEQTTNRRCLAPV